MNEIELKHIYSDIGVQLERCGRNLRGVCPFHQEDTPSFFVFTDNGSYKCFGCGKSGSLDHIKKELGDENFNLYPLFKIDIDSVSDRSNNLLGGFIEKLEKSLQKNLKNKSVSVKSKMYDQFDQLKMDVRFDSHENLVKTIIDIKKRFQKLVNKTQ